MDTDTDTPNKPPNTLIAALKNAVATYGHKRLEIEFRIGRIVNSKFVPGVTRDAFLKIQDHLRSLPSQNINTTETIFKDCKRIYDHDTQVTSVLHKKKIHATDVESAMPPWTVRAAIALEEPGEIQELGAAHSVYERTKRRTRFTSKGWAIDLTRVASNLPDDLDSDSETYEVEVELLDVDSLYTRTVMEVLHWGLKISNDMVGFAAAG